MLLELYRDQARSLVPVSEHHSNLLPWRRRVKYDTPRSTPTAN